MENFIKWLEKHNIKSRDKSIEIYSFFKKKPDLMGRIFLINNEDVYIEKPIWIEEINTTDIRNHFKIDKVFIKPTEINTDRVESIDISYEEVENYNLRLMKEVQNLRDKNTQLRRHNRETFRDINKSEELVSELTNVIKSVDWNFEKKSSFVCNKDKKGIIQLSDLHFDMFVNEPSNYYDFEVASKRLRNHIQNSIKLFKDNRITDVYVINTGDTISSTRRTSEKYNRLTSRARAMIISIKLLALALDELSDNFNVFYASCSANESRLEEILDFDDFSASENFDIMIHNMLYLLLKDKGINFLETDLIEGVIDIFDNFKVLITHGANIPDANLQKKIQEIKGKFASRQVLIDYIIFGDKHSAYISDKFARGASLCGSNGYSDSNLGFDSRASQNCFIVSCDKVIDGYKKDVQDSDHIEGYDIQDELIKFKVKKGK